MPQMGANPRLADMRLALVYATEGSAPRPSEPCCTLAPAYQDSLSRREDSGTPSRTHHKLAPAPILTASVCVHPGSAYP